MKNLIKKNTKPYQSGPELYILSGAVSKKEELNVSDVVKKLLLLLNFSTKNAKSKKFLLIGCCA